MFKIISSLFIVLITLTACQNVKDGLTGQKKKNTDEFLVKKKSPLVLPPDFDQLPVPKKTKDNSAIEEENDLKKILTQDKSKIDTASKNEPSNDSLEKSIIEKIKSN
ncbi:DUF3035 domain-containing protein [Candidatus Pelagibacter sp. Uisw_134_02]|uniref:DUF3035 domain-containing protein n=1 Tax=Candidatus Pelagibacter sp. Uisw_134_02 TaxID=3230990 RepID=UPI0039E9BED2